MAGLILTLDASTPRCVIAVGRVDVDAGTAELLGGEAVSDRPNQASVRLVPRIEALLQRVGVAPGELTHIGCGRGPGTFTGTRVAVATAMGLAVGAKCPAIAVSSLAAVAASVDGSSEEQPVLPLLDARREEVYGARFVVALGAGLPRVQRSSDERCTGLPTLLSELEVAEDSPLIPIGPGVAPYRALLPKALADRAIEALGPTPEGLWAATVSALAAGDVDAAAALRAVYLRKSYAEMGINPPRKPVKRSPFL